MTELELEKVNVPIEVPEINPDKQFDSVVSYLNYLSHQITDIGAVAARLISERKAKYTFHLKQNEAFLREYALAHMKRDANGEIKGRNYRSLTAGGGVFFRAKPEKITIDQEHLKTLKAILAPYLGDTDLIREKTVYEVPNEQGLIKEVRIMIKARAEDAVHELKKTVEMTEEQSKEALEDFIKQGENEIFGMGGIIEIDEADAFAHMAIGSTKGWNGKDTKALLTKAIDGKLVENDDDEIEMLLEKLE